MQKKLVILLISGLISGNLYAQDAVVTLEKNVPRGWHLLDLKENGVYGIGAEKAYKELLKNKKSKTVIVAVIDSGVDTTHEDLKPILWKNPGEIPGNGKDDDKNGYVDDYYGWNFLGGKDGRNVNKDSYEGARLYYKYKKKYGETIKDVTKLSPEEAKEVAAYQAMKLKREEEAKNASMNVMYLRNPVEKMKGADSVLKIALNKTEYTGIELEKYKASNTSESKARAVMMMLFQGFDKMEMTNKFIVDATQEYYDSQVAILDAIENEPKDFRGEVVKDNYYDLNDRYYGNPDVMAGFPTHGTHVSGIIGAVRNNNKGMNGVADNIKIMTIRAVPNGDEHDKDIALAIRYAVDNGAQVINMSFGKSYSPEKHWVDEAVRYAESKDVLLVHAAGNSHENIDVEDNFPNALINNDSTKRFSNWITVGASGDLRQGSLVAEFSNYGKNQVDVFAPGVEIYSTMPGGDKYDLQDGTSMASPVVAGLAALLRSYFPQLTASQIKFAIEKASTTGTEVLVTKPGTEEEIKLSEICKTGGIVNAYEAVRIASGMKGEKKLEEVLPQPKLKKSTAN